MLDKLRSPDADVSQWVTDLVVIALWTPLILVLLGLALGIVGLGVQLATGGIPPSSLAAIGTAVNPTLVVLGLAVGVGYLYLLLANETFGTETVEATTEQAQELADEAQEQT